MLVVTEVTTEGPDYMGEDEDFHEVAVMIGGKKVGAGIWIHEFIDGSCEIGGEYDSMEIIVPGTHSTIRFLIQTGTPVHYDDHERCSEEEYDKSLNEYNSYKNFMPSKEETFKLTASEKRIVEELRNN